MYLAEQDDLQVLTSNGNAGGRSSSDLDIIDETRKRRNTTNEEGCDGSPVRGEFGRVAVHAMEVVHVGHRDPGLPDNVVAAGMTRQWTEVSNETGDHVLANQNGRHRSKEDSIATKESQKLRRRSEDFPLRPRLADCRYRL